MPGLLCVCFLSRLPNNVHFCDKETSQIRSVSYVHCSSWDSLGTSTHPPTHISFSLLVGGSGEREWVRRSEGGQVGGERVGEGWQVGGWVEAQVGDGQLRPTAGTPGMLGLSGRGTEEDECSSLGYCWAGGTGAPHRPAPQNDSS